MRGSVSNGFRGSICVDFPVMIADGKIQFVETAHIEVLCTATNISERDYNSIIEKYLDNCTNFEEVYKALFY